mmetsp:Transcript_2962/g.7977  ORF Transcript_2962/g.7977 Transcript_2962/m.7977 type:complete len:246 (+) Transcript_2962:218-955(+)
MANSPARANASTSSLRNGSASKRVRFACATSASATAHAVLVEGLSRARAAAMDGRGRSGLSRHAQGRRAVGSHSPIVFVPPRSRRPARCRHDRRRAGALVAAVVCGGPAGAPPQLAGGVPEPRQHQDPGGGPRAEARRPVPVGSAAPGEGAPGSATAAPRARAPPGAGRACCHREAGPRGGADGQSALLRAQVPAGAGGRPQEVAHRQACRRHGSGVHHSQGAGRPECQNIRLAEETVQSRPRLG